jgi:cytochrome P450
MSVRDTARAECVFGLALNGNTVPTAFWVIWHIFSDAAVLARVRQELEAFVSAVQDADEGVQTLNLDLRRVKEAQYLQAAIQETLRYRARGTGPRMVLEDVTLSGDGCEYHLEKGSTLILAHEGMHYNTAVWGSNADTFVPDRFLPGNKIPANAFRGFGGGANLCPGKSFAIAEITSLVAMLVMRVDLKPAGGRWKEPGQDASNMARENPPPLRKVMVDVGPRAGTENVVWKYSL